MASSDYETLRVADPAESAAIIRDVLAGRQGPPRDYVVANAAAALWTARRDETPALAARRAEDAIDSGAASDLLTQLAQRTGV